MYILLIIAIYYYNKLNQESLISQQILFKKKCTIITTLQIIKRTNISLDIFLIISLV